MLDVSLRASQAISTLISLHSRSSAGGLRISLARRRPEHSAGFALSVRERPVQGDQVAAGDLGSRVFLDPTTARCLTDQVLDVQPDDNGKFRFTVRRKSRGGRRVCRRPVR
ncbi:iron-sulfur cluster biosynthesis protein [Lentzea sp. NPDC034063]|uniref:iron-sulfur cluster biosynthesis protein n=1 Tax=unclassified Lentzea TaxID=2643253 RepID=UPI0033DE9A9B